MLTVRNLSKTAREKLLRETLDLFVEWCRLEAGMDLYRYQVEDIGYWCLYSLLVEPVDIYIKISRQAGKTECITLLLRFLIIFHKLFTGDPLMAGIASPKGEQAKTDTDRLKKSIVLLRDRWQVEDREFNKFTIRAYRMDQLFAEVFTFSLAPGVTNESKTLNLLVVEEAHKTDDTRRSDQLDPMLASTGGPSWYIGVGVTHQCDFKKGCDGELPDSKAIVIDVDKVIADRRKKYEQTKEPKHLEYEKAFKRELKRKGRDNPEIKRNFYLEDMVEEGNFVSRERLLSCARAETIAPDKLYLGIDWGRVSDKTWVALGTANEVLRWFVYPSVRYEEQIEMMMADLEPYRGIIKGVCGDSTGQGDFPMEYLESNTWLPVDDGSFIKFTLQSKNEMYGLFDDVLFIPEGDDGRFSYPADDPHTAEFEQQMIELVREYKGDQEYLSPHHPDKPGAKDDACDSTALMLMAASVGTIEDIIVG